jgi:hypothetical protein
MAKAKGMPKGLGLVLAVVGLAWDVSQAIEHQRTCRACEGQDLLTIAFDVAHLVGMS